MAVILSAFTQPKVLATTGVAGFALQNATPTILTYTAPNDGNVHFVTVSYLLNVTVNEVGGDIVLGLAGKWTIGTLGGGITASQGNWSTTAAMLPGDTLTLRQSVALTGGAATAYGTFQGQ